MVAAMRVTAASTGAPIVAMPGGVMMVMMRRMRVIRILVMMMMVRRRRAAPATEAQKHRHQQNRYHPGAFHIHSLSVSHKKTENFLAF
jgi:hypothetical protein